MTIRTTVSSNVYFPSNSHPLWSTHSSTLPTGITSNYYDQRYAQQRPTDPIFRTPIIRSGVPTHFSFPNTATHLGFYSNSYADMFGTNDPYMNQLRTTAATSSFGQNNGSSTNYQHTSSNRKNDLSSNKNKLYTSPILGSNTSDINVSLSSHHHHSTISNGHRHSHSTNGTLSPSIIDSSGSYHPSQQETNRAILNYQKSDERQLFPLKRSHSPGQNSIHHSSSDDLQTTPINEDILILKKFRRENFVTLSSGEMKNIEKLTTNDFIKSADDSNEYSSILTRVEDVGVVDNKSGKAQIIFDITELQKRIIYDVLEEMPFFVYQQTWSSINPNKTRTVCGLKCRQLEKGDLIIAAMEQDNLTSILTSSLATPSSSPPPSSTSISKNTALSHLSPCKTTPTKFLFKRYIDENTGKNKL
ncbi:unnamed protein product [Didymodactylos carnosus]|uniref:AXH domain-containing protein n=1 Tax=Didymodactylos carnosus TaxID=1234261 RepID=A0A8S2CK61_9BILA|nr:unnamed protein product [Didymodactylos carnosus]CAF3495508.1 unnamed protein product [Didymodactylos carnosus]